MKFSPREGLPEGLQLDDRLRRAVVALERTELRHGLRWLLLCAVIGIAAGLGALLFDYLSRLGVHLFLERLAGWRPELPAGEEALYPDFVVGQRHLWILFLLPGLGGLLSGALVGWLAPEAAGHGTDAAIDAYHRKAGYIRPLVPLVKIISSALTLGSGGSGGREGPIAQSGAGFGSFIATRLRLSNDERRILMAAGLGAGIGSIFRAPLAGALFASEVLYSTAEFEASVMIPACIASIIAYCTFTVAHGSTSLFHTPHLQFSNPQELLGYLVLALVLVVYGFIYVRIYYGVHGHFERLRLPLGIKAMIGGLLTGGIGVGLLLATKQEEALGVLGFGYGVLQHAMDPRGAVSIGATLLALIALGKILTTSFSIATGGSAGVFGPSMVIGGCVGGAVGLLLNAHFPQMAPQPAAFVVVGMAGFFAGVANTPISTLVMVSEITGSYSLLLPSMWVCVLTFAMSRRWNLYVKQVPGRIDSPAHQGRFAIDILRDIRVSDVLRDGKVHVLQEDEPFRQVVAAVATTQQSVFPVVRHPDPNDPTKETLVGVIHLEQIRRVLNEELPPDLIIARDLMVEDVPPVGPQTDLATILRMFASLEVDEVVVWDEDNRHILGLLSRREVTRAYVERMSPLGITK